jgi:CDP-paratose 2-epimerase
MNILVTGAAGSIGSEACLYFSRLGHDIVGIDNFMRGEILGSSGDTRSIFQYLKEQVDDITLLEIDIRNTGNPSLRHYVSIADVIIHTAAQPSHPRSIEIPWVDMEINVIGTLNLLELVRKYNPDCMFLFCSTNKVYGENPNNIPIVELETRYDYKYVDGVDENMSLDKTKHTPFGVSKAACDLYVQEYAKVYGITTGVFRLGCITGGRAKAVELHNWEPYFVRKNLLGETLNIYGFKGKQVRDVIHVYDFVRLLDEFIKYPKSGEVFNVGGGRQNSISLLEAIDLIENITNKKMDYKLCEGREGDHKVYISDISKARHVFMDWKITRDLDSIFNELVEQQEKLLYENCTGNSTK